MKRLHNVLVHEISVVDVPAVRGARVVLAKAGDPIEKAERAVREYVVSKAEVREAVEMAKAGVAAPKTFWTAALRAIGVEVGADFPETTQMHLALQTPAGLELMRAAHNARS